MPVQIIDVSRVLDEGSWSAHQKLVVFFTALAIVFDGLDNQLLGIAVPAMVQEWNVPRGAFAPVLAAGMFGMMIGGAVAGVVGDRVGRRIALIGSVVTFRRAHGRRHGGRHARLAGRPAIRRRPRPRRRAPERRCARL